MISGHVTVTRKPLVPLTILDHHGNPHTIRLILDTGFTGQLLLPERFVNRLGLTMDRFSQGHPVGDQYIRIPAGFATVIWRGSQRSVHVLQLGTEPLLGMEFLWNHRITIDAVTDGAVSITPLIKDRMGG